MSCKLKVFFLVFFSFFSFFFSFLEQLPKCSVCLSVVLDELIAIPSQLIHYYRGCSSKNLLRECSKYSNKRLFLILYYVPKLCHVTSRPLDSLLDLRINACMMHKPTKIFRKGADGTCSKIVLPLLGSK